MAEPRWSLHFAWGRAPYALDLPEIVIGRGDGCPLQITEPEAGEEHARFVVDDDERVWLEDLATGKPTLHNGRAITTRTRLVDGDFIQIGHSVLTLRGRAEPSQLKSTPDARTISTTNLPEEVRRVLAERDAAAAKNFVVGEDEPSPMATMMMESPVLRPETSSARDPQRTVEANADELMAAIRRNTAAATSAAPPPSADSGRPGMVRPTLIGVGPAELGGNSELSSAPTMIGASPTPTKSQPSLEPAPLPSLTGSIPTPLQLSDSQRTAVGDEILGPRRELAAAPTMMAPAPADPRRRSPTAPDLTPLPVPMPPHASIGDLGPLVQALTNKSGSEHPTFEVTGEVTRTERKPMHGMGGLEDDRSTLTDADSPPTINSAQTRQLAAVASSEGPSSLSTQKTQLPMQAPVITGGANVTEKVPPAASPTEKVPPAKFVEQRLAQEKRAATSSRPAGQPYQPPTKGAFGSFSRAFDFGKQMFELSRRERVIMKPIFLDLSIATPISIAISLLLLFVHSASAAYALMGLGTAALYFVDYYCNAMTASLMYDYVSTGAADLGAARARVNKSLPGIMTFAAVSAFLDVASTYARERNDVLAKIILRILHAIWTTATYVIMPAMVIEGVPFGEAFARSKKLMDRDPTGVGAGVVALSICSYLVGAIIFPLAFFMMRLGAHVHPALGLILYFTLVNLYWSLSGWLKIAYSTCFYMWAARCEAERQTDHALAPLPLRHALDAA